MQLPFTARTGLFVKKGNLLKTRVVIYTYQQHVRLLSPEPAVVEQPQSTRVKEPTLLCNQVPNRSPATVKLFMDLFAERK